MLVSTFLLKGGLNQTMFLCLFLLVCCFGMNCSGSLYPLSFNAFSYCSLASLNIFSFDELSHSRLLIDVGNCFITCGGGLMMC